VINYIFTAQRRLPPRPVPEPPTSASEAIYETQCNRFHRRLSIPENPPPLPPTNDTSSPVNDQNPAGRNRSNVMTKQNIEPSLTSAQTQSSESPTSKLLTLKSKTSALFSKNLLSKSNLFQNKSPKQDKANECEYSCCTDKKSANQSPKPFRKIHPIAEMIKRKKNAIQTGFFSSSLSSKTTVIPQSNKNNSPPCSPPRSKAKLTLREEKKVLAPVHSLPLLNNKKVGPPTATKVLTTTKSSPSLVTEQYKTKTTRSHTEGHLSGVKTSPKPQVPVEKENSEAMSNNPSQNQSFLYRRGSDIRFDDKPTSDANRDVPKPPPKPKVTRSHTFDGINAESLMAESYEVPFYLQDYANADISPVLNSIESDVFAFSPKPELSPGASSDRSSSSPTLEKLPQNTQRSQVNEKQSQFEKLRSNFSKVVSISPFSSVDTNGTEPNHNVATSKVKTTRSSTAPPTNPSPTAKENGKKSCLSNFFA